MLCFGIRQDRGSNVGDVEHGKIHKCQVNNVGELFYQLDLDLNCMVIHLRGWVSKMGSKIFLLTYFSVDH